LETRLRDNDKALRRAYLTTIKAARDTERRPPAAEWLMDNFHVLSEQVLQSEPISRQDFTVRFPNSPMDSSRVSRVFGLAWALVAHSTAD